MYYYNILKRLIELGYSRPLNPGAFVDGDKFIICLTHNNETKPIESQPTREKAQKGCDILNNHAKNCGLRAVYHFEELS